MQYKMSIFKVATVLVYVTSVLTSTVNGYLTPDENSSPHSGLNAPFGSVDPGNKSSNIPKAHNESIQVGTEGGPMTGYSSITSETGAKSSTNPAVEVKDISLPDKNLALIPQFDGTLGPLQIKARKGAENERKTVGRKGVDFDTTQGEADNDKSDQVSPSNNVTDGANASTVRPDLRTEATEPLVQKNGSSTDAKGVTKSPVLLIPGQHRPKPTVTSGEGNDDGEGITSSPTRTDFGMPKKVDYIIPVVITIMAMPVLGIAAYILYTRGRDCWEKRHYRRMDFLIDGMYND